MSTAMTDFLTPKQRAFCDEYLIDRNATAAALRAGYSKNVALNGSLMAVPKIKLYLAERTEALARKVQVNAEMVLAELCKIAFGNLGNYFGADGALKPMDQLSADEKAALWSVSVTDAGSGAAAGLTTKIRMYNKLTALDKIARHLNFYKPEVKEAEKEYVYLDEDDLGEDDWLDEEEEASPRPSPKERGFEFDTKSDDRAMDESEQPVADEGVVFVDGAGIPYGETTDGYKTDPDEPVAVPDEMQEIAEQQQAVPQLSLSVATLSRKQIVDDYSLPPIGQVRKEIERDRRMGISGRFV